MQDIFQEEIMELEDTISEEVTTDMEQTPPDEPELGEQTFQNQVDSEDNTVAEVVAILKEHGGSGQAETVLSDLVEVMESLKREQILEVERSQKEGMLTFALTNLVHDPGAILSIIDLDKVTFDPSDIGELRDFLEPIYQEKPYLFKVITPLRGANIAVGIANNPMPTNGELGTLSMEEYTAYRNARGGVSH